MKNICYESTKECNLKCDYCISSDNQNSTEETVDYHKIIDTIALFQPQRIVISGGEPMLDRELMHKIEYIEEKCPNSFISLSTNGTVDYPFQQLVNKIDCIDFSIPALNQEIYCAMRGVDLVRKVRKNIVTAQEAGLDIRLSYTLTKVNSQELIEVLEFAKKVQASEMRIGRYFPFRNAAAYQSKYEMTDKEINAVLDEIKKERYPFRIVPPIQDLEYMEKGYLTINYLGEIFLPTRVGKNILAKVGESEGDEIKELVEEEQNKIFRTTNMQTKQGYIKDILTPRRIRKSLHGRERSGLEEYYSDRSRILYSQAFRRLQQKAQVFSLETNSSVHSRLTHSLEVSDVGRLITKKIIEKLENKNYQCFAGEDREKAIAVVENACLLHDLGNPPFGHFGEAAIQKWWKENYKLYIDTYNSKASTNNENAIAFTTEYQRLLLKDFEQFDGNPQGIRTILRFRRDEVVGEKDMFDNMIICETGMNLTYQTVLSCIKYVRGAGEYKKEVDERIQKKAGYFQSEKSVIEKMYEELNLSEEKRFPFVYIMEAADDISYCMSDVADSIEKGLTTLKKFTEDFRKIWKELYDEEVPEIIIPAKKQKYIDEGAVKDINYTLATEWAWNLIDVAAERFVSHLDGFVKGKEIELLPHREKATESEVVWCKLLECLGEYARREIYSATEAESIEIAGYSVIKGILDSFGQLLTLTRGEFEYLLTESKNPKKIGLDVEARYLHMIGKKYIYSYKNQIKEWESNLDGINREQVEWWLRVHMIIDHIAGMTDDYALKTYQVCKGITINTL